MESKTASEINDLIEQRRKVFGSVIVTRDEKGVVTVAPRGGVPERYVLWDPV